MPRISQGFLKREMLKAMQCIVMHKIKNGRLAGQDMIQMV